MIWCPPFYACYYNVTFNRESNTQILVGVNINEATYITLIDPTLSTIILNGNKTNSIQFRIMTTLMISECERMAIQSSNQTISMSTLIAFSKDIVNSTKNVTYEYNNNTKIMTIITENSSYVLEIDWNTGVVKTLMNTTTFYGKIQVNDTLKGAMGGYDQGGCYHEYRSDFLTDLINHLIGILGSSLNSATNDIFDIAHNPPQEVVSALEDMGGNVAITAGMLLIFGSGGLATPVGVALILGGAAACFHAGGINSINDLTDPYKFLQGALSVSLALTGCNEASLAKDVVKIASCTTKKETAETVFKTSLNRNNYDTFGGRCFEYGKGKLISWGAEGFLVYGTNVMEDNA